MLPTEDFQEVYDGVWGFNAILASASLMCVFYAFNFYSVLLGTFNLACVICAQYAMRATMSVEVRRLGSSDVEEVHTIFRLFPLVFSLEKVINGIRKKKSGSTTNIAFSDD